MPVVHRVKLTGGLTAADLRRRLARRLQTGDEIMVAPAPLSFTQTRTLLAVINAAAWIRQAAVRYADEPTAYPPPLLPRYTHRPHITASKSNT